jgi:hypothetical protein
VQLSSIVFPRNQVNQNYLNELLESGIICYRGNEKNWMYREMVGSAHPVSMRAGRLIDAYFNVSGNNLTSWGEVMEPSGICNIPSSRFIRPYIPTLRNLDALRLKRIKNAIHEAATSNKIIHLWTHAHNLGVNQNENLDFLRAIFTEYRNLQDRYGMRSLTMREVALQARGEA